MDSPFSLTTASTSTLIIHIPDPNTTDEKEIRISAEPDSTAHNPETNDTPTNPTRNHLNLSIAPPPPPSSLPNPFNNVASARKGPPLQIATAPHTSQSAKMSGRGFVEPHHSHLPRRTRMRVVSRSRSRRRSRSSSSSSWARSSRSRTRMEVGKVDEAQESPQPQPSTQDENPHHAPAPEEPEADDDDDAETDFDSNKTEDGFLHETESVHRANAQKELLSALERGKMRPSYAYTLERLLGPSFNAPRTPQLESNPLLASMTIPEPQATPGAGPLTKDSTTSQHLQPHVGNLPRRRKTIQASYKRAYIDRRTPRSVSQGVSTLRRSLSNDDYNDDEGLGGREEEVRGRDRRGFSLERIGSLREDGGEDGLANGYGHPHPRLDSSRPPRSVPPGYRSTSVSVSKRVDQREPLRERMKLQEVGRGVWIGVCDEDIRLRCRKGNTEEEKGGDGNEEEWRGRKGWDGGSVSQNATTNIWEDVEREIDTLSHSTHPTKKRRRIRGILTIDETDSLSSSPTASSPALSSSKPPPPPPNGSLQNLCLTVPSLSSLASKRKGGEPIEIARGCTRLSVEQMKEGCKFMGVVLSSRSVSGDVREREGRGGEDSEEPITLLLASNEECMVDVMSMALCYLVVQEIGGGAGGCSGLGREGGEDGESEVVEERVVGEEERMVESQPAPPGENAPGSDALDPPTTTARLNLDPTSPSVLSPCATVRPSVGVEEDLSRVEGKVVHSAEGGDERGLKDEHWDGGMKDRGERRVEGHGGPEVAQEGSRDEADNSRVDVEPLRPVGSLEGNTTSADDSTAPTAMDESATSTTTEDHSTTLPRFEGEDEEGYTPVHRLMWKLHDEYEVRVIRPVKPLAEGEDEEVDVVGLDGEAGDEKGGAQVYMNGIFTPPQLNTAKFSNSKPVSKLGQPDFQSSEPRPSQPGPEVPREPVPRNPDLQSRQFLPSTSVFCTSTRIVRVRLREEWRGLVGYEGVSGFGRG
ncbi:hypothetical protein CC2G_008434 [Coprinopsis cinerea AmutBmut pab1-1]|nr:hypothetical protein CC2G_008434 [Coprinopsis cinerea AmutBmut pab1-1]